MRRVLIAAVLACGAYFGWVYFGQSIGPLSSSEARAVKRGVEQKIYTQGGTLQEPIAVKIETDAKFICGWYERSGTLKGRIAFVGLLFHGQTEFHVASTAENNSELVTLRDVCNARGLLL